MICCNIRIILYKSYLIRGAFPGKTEVCRFAARGMRPPFSLVLPKKTGRARSKRKTPLCPNPSLRSGLDRTGVERDGAPKIDSLLPGALESWGTEMVLPRIWGLGAAFGAVDVWNCFSFTVSRCGAPSISVTSVPLVPPSAGSCGNGAAAGKEADTNSIRTHGAFPRIVAG